MAYTKIHAIKQTLDKALDYIENPDKTDYAMLISGYNIEPECATLEMTLTQIQANSIQGNRVHFNQSGNLAYHMIQSFAPTDNVTPEQAHEIGKRLADEFLGGQYEYVIATHIDKGHIHNHIIFNATSWYTFKKFRTNPAWTAREIRNISDRLCADANLSVIKTKKELGRSYQYVPKKTSYRQLIRQRIRVAIQAATSWDEYCDAMERIGVSIDDTGKYTTYKLEGQERGTRDRALSGDGAFSKATITETLEKNKIKLDTLKAEITDAVSSSDSYDAFIEQLTLRGVTAKKERGGVKYFLDDDDTGISEWTMGAAYSTVAIKAAIVTGEMSFENNDAIDIVAEQWERAARPLAEEIGVKVSWQNILQTTADGVLLAVPGTEPVKQVFIDSSKVKYLTGEDTFIVAVTAPYKYAAIDPNGERSELRGEDLIRSLELAEGVPPKVRKLSGEDIKSLSAKGVTVCLPEFGIEKLFIPAEYVEYDDQALGGAVRIALWDHWSYRFQTDGKEKFVIGSELIRELEKRQDRIDHSIAGRLQSMQRRNLIAETKQLAETLNLLRREGIDQHKDFDTRIEALRSRSDEVMEQINRIQQKNSQYKLAAKYLLAIQKYEPYELELNMKINSLRKGAYEKEHEQDLNTLYHARSELRKMGVNLTVDPQKVMELVKQQDNEAAELSHTARELRQRVLALQTAQKAVESLQSGKNGTSERRRETETPTH